MDFGLDSPLSDLLCWCLGLARPWTSKPMVDLLNIVEKSLSVDNLLVFALLFQYFDIGPLQQARYLYWGIWGSAIMRAAFIGLGVALIAHWVWLVWGLRETFLVFTAAKDAL